MYEVEYTIDAIEDLKFYKKHERQLIVDPTDEQLSLEPTHETRNRKRLRPDRVAEFELRIMKFRVFYDVDENEEVVKIDTIGHKEGNRLFIRGKEYRL